MVQKKYNRRTYLIKKTFQLKFVVWFIVFLGIGTVFSGILLYIFGATELETAFSSAHLTIENTRNILKGIILISHITGLLTVSIAAGFLVVFFSHRLAGPLYRLEKTVDDMANGYFDTEITFRKNDELTPLKIAFNAMLASLTKNLNKLRENHEKLEHITRRLEESELPDDTAALVRSLKQTTDEYGSLMDFYNLKQSENPVQGSFRNV